MTCNFGGIMLTDAEVYLESEEEFLTLPLSSSTSSVYVIWDLPQWFFWYLPFKCNKCGQISLFQGEIEIGESHQREMGSQVIYGGSDTFYCEKCDNEITVEVSVDNYAHGWDVEIGTNEATPMLIEGLENFLEGLHDKSCKLKELEVQKTDLESRLQVLVEHAIKTRGYVLIVEGDDDEEVWGQLIRNFGIDSSRVNIAKYGDGGLNSAIKAAKFFRGRILKSTPHKLIIDSDNERKKVIQELKKHGIKPVDCHILRRKEIESYLMDSHAIAQILNVSKSIIDYNMKEFGCSGKEELNKIFKKHTGKKATPSLKGVLARALNPIPAELKKILEEINIQTTKMDRAIEDNEDY